MWRLRFPLSLSFLLSGLVVAVFAAQQPRIVRTVVISDELKIGIAPGDLVYLYAKPLPGEGFAAFVRRFTDDPATARKIRRLNKQEPILRANTFVRVPYEFLSDNYKKIAIRALFPDDSASSAGWVHTVTAPSGGPESLWRIAEWFTGDGANYSKIRAADKIASLETSRGQKVLIAPNLLLPVFASEAEAREVEGPPPLTYSKDAAGPYAAYRLRKGEALYSAVVVRFTGLIYAAEVNAEALRIATRSGIRDVHSISVGHEVRIPLADLLPEYLPADNPVRVAYERQRLETAQFTNRLRAQNLAGVTVILDPGHGGRDTGADVDGVAEAPYAYDITSRIAEILRRHTRARVIVTVHDPDIRDLPRRDRLAVSPGGEVMTSPPYPIDDVVASVHLRWYLANAILKREEEAGVDPSRVIFLSVHADSLHPSVRGAMVYIPGAKFLKGSYEKHGEVYEARREYRVNPRVSFTRRQRLQAEGVSRDLGEKLIGAFRENSLPVHTFNPIRENVIRRGREWVPAVLRYNEIPARALLEVCNLNNEDDRALIETRLYREKVARAVVAALSRFYEPGERRHRRPSLEKTASRRRR